MVRLSLCVRLLPKRLVAAPSKQTRQAELEQKRYLGFCVLSDVRSDYRLESVYDLLESGRLSAASPGTVKNLGRMDELSWRFSWGCNRMLAVLPEKEAGFTADGRYFSG